MHLRINGGVLVFFEDEPGTIPLEPCIPERFDLMDPVVSVHVPRLETGDRCGVPLVTAAREAFRSDKLAVFFSTQPRSHCRLECERWITGEGGSGVLGHVSLANCERNGVLNPPTEPNAIRTPELLPVLLPVLDLVFKLNDDLTGDGDWGVLNRLGRGSAGTSCARLSFLTGVRCCS